MNTVSARNISENREKSKIPAGESSFVSYIGRQAISKPKLLENLSHLNQTLDVDTRNQNGMYKQGEKSMLPSSARDEKRDNIEKKSQQKSRGAQNLGIISKCPAFLDDDI
jgi:hypothetical protein